MGNNTTSYVLDSNRSLPVVLYDGDAWYLYGLDLIAKITSGGPPAQRQQYYHYDGLGSTRALTDANGNTSATYNYDVFGTVRSQTGNVTNDFQYTGEQKDTESQYYFLRARYYDPAVGRFVSRDSEKIHEKVTVDVINKEDKISSLLSEDERDHKDRASRTQRIRRPASSTQRLSS